MKFTDGLIAGRSHIIFVLGLLASTWLILTIEAWETNPVRHYKTLTFSTSIPDPAPRPLNNQELAWARTAWRYLDRHTRAETGLCDQWVNRHAATLWDIGSQVFAVISAERIGIITADDAQARITRVLDALERMPLGVHGLPATAYDTQTLAPFTGAVESRRGLELGWSAIDIGRLLNALNLWSLQNPSDRDRVTKIVGAWNLSAAIEGRQLISARAGDGGDIVRFTETDFGYRHYAAKGFALFGHDVSEAMSVLPVLGWVDIDGVEVPIDRNIVAGGAPPVIVPEPWLADGFEYGWDRINRELTWRLYLAEERRYNLTRRITASGHGPLDRAPWYGFSTTMAENKAWTVALDGKAIDPGLRTVSTSTGMAWPSFFGTVYSELLQSSLNTLFDPENGWYGGYFEENASANSVVSLATNALVLESLAYRGFGPLRAAPFGGGPAKYR